MAFAWWPVLWVLFLPASILVWVWMARGRRIVMPLDHGRSAPGRMGRFLVNSALSIPALLLAIAILMLAGPRIYGVPRTKRALTNIEFCLDVSGSMSWSMGDVSRSEAALNAIIEFVSRRDGDAFGMTIFSNKPMRWLPLTTDISAFRCATPFLRPRMFYRTLGGGTEIGKALRYCNAVLSEQEEGDRMVILVSDGASADLGNGAEEVIARELRDNGVVVYAIHIGGGGVPPEVSVITNITGGRAFSPGDERGLQAVFERIDQMQVARLESTYAEELDFFRPFALTGLGLLSAGLAASFGIRYTPW